MEMINNEDMNKFVHEMNRAYYSYCNTIITLSTGGLMVSMIFVEKSLLREGTNYLVVSWLFFILTILLALVVKWSEVVAYKIVIDKMRTNPSGYIFADPGKKYQLARKFMFICFLAAIVFLSTFAIKNINEPIATAAPPKTVVH